MPKRKNASAYQKLCSSRVLHKAWNQIFQNGIQSDSKSTRAEVRDFKENDFRNIERIYRQLFKKQFVFKNNKGITIGDKKRPVVLAPVESRIVQRAILDVLQSEIGMQKFLQSKGSYGALKSSKEHEKGVPAAIKDIAQAIERGATTYYKSDIKSFFTEIPREKVIGTISKIIPDQEFLQILENATNLEVDNINSLPEEVRKFFDFNTIGTPQGCCLSPLLGNILLYEFDNELNQGAASCFRYLDDFLILGDGWGDVKASFNTAHTILESLGLSVYKINDGSNKAKSGHISESFQFLGVEFKGKNIRPSKESRDRLRSSIKKILQDSLLQDYSGKATKEQRECSLISTFSTINNKILGWGNQYYFCNDAAIWGSLDAEIDELIKGYLGRYKSNKDKADIKQRRRMFGVHLISESKSDPILITSENN